MEPDRAATSEVRHPALLATTLTAAAGYLDAVGFSEVNSLFVSFMSGNTTRFGTAFVAGDIRTALSALGVIALFVAGAAIGGFLTDRATRPLRPVLRCELVLLCVAALLFWSGIGGGGLLLLAAAMGLQNSSLQLVNGATVGKSFMTGTLVSFGQGLGRALSRGPSADGTSAYGLSWLTFATAVIVGAMAWANLGASASIAIAIAAVGMLLVLSTKNRL